MLTDHNKFEYFPTDAELEILQILWKNGSATVREVFEQLALRKDIKYTTALKLMQIMHEKGLCSRVAQGKLHIYKPLVQDDQIKMTMVDSIVDQVFGGVAMELVLQTLGNYQATPNELKEIKLMIEKLEKSNPS